VNGVREGKFSDFRAGYLREVYGAKMIPLYLKGNLTSGQLNGNFVYTYTNGKTAKTEIFVAGILEGPKIVFDSLGNKMDSSNYKNNQRQGKAFHFYPSGKIEREENYENGKKTGQQKTFLENGKPLSIETIQNGITTEKFNFDSKGKKIKEKIIDDKQPNNIGDLLDEPIQKKDTIQEEAFVVVDEMPEYPGGTQEMYKFIQKNIKYPQIAKEAGITGKCFLKFTIDKEGQVKDVIVMKGVPACPECDKESVRVIQRLPNFKPGKMNGKVVRVSMMLPIKFEMQ
jgi:TonB family protein